MDVNTIIISENEIITYVLIIFVINNCGLMSINLQFHLTTKRLGKFKFHYFF